MHVALFLISFLPSIALNAGGWGTDNRVGERAVSQRNAPPTLQTAHAECRIWQRLQQKINSGKITLDPDAEKLLEGVMDSCSDINETYTQTTRALNHYNADVNDILVGQDPDQQILRQTYNNFSDDALGRTRASPARAQGIAQGSSRIARQDTTNNRSDLLDRQMERVGAKVLNNFLSTV